MTEDVAKQLEQHLDVLRVSLQLLSSNPEDPTYVEAEHKIEQLLSSMKEFYRKVLLNPRVSLTKLQQKKLEENILSLQEDLIAVLDSLSPDHLGDKARWILERFLSEKSPQDPIQQLVNLSIEIHKFLNIGFPMQIEKNPFLVLVNEVVGWSEHLFNQGDNDPSSVVLFGAKLARDRAAMEGRIQLASEICSKLQGLSSEEIGKSFSKEHIELYRLLLEDVEIMLVSSEDYEIFLAYCQENTIEIYEEYQETIKKMLENYARSFSFNLHQIIEKLTTSAVINSAERLFHQYEKVHKLEDTQGLDLKLDQYILEGIVRTLGEKHPTVTQQCQIIINHIKQLRGIGNEDAQEE